MEDKPKSVFEKLDSIESLQRDANSKNDKIIDMLQSMNNKMEKNAAVDKPVQKSQPRKNEHVINFLKNAKKEYIWVGTDAEFFTQKIALMDCSLILLFVGLLTTIFTSIACKAYGTFTFFENIWMVFVFFNFTKFSSLKTKLSHTSMRVSSNRVFSYVELIDLWVDEEQEKGKNKWFRRIAILCAILNITYIALNSGGGVIAIISYILEIVFLTLSFIVGFLTNDFLDKYEKILCTDKNSSSKGFEVVYDIKKGQFLFSDEKVEINDVK